MRLYGGICRSIYTNCFAAASGGFSVYFVGLLSIGLFGITVVKNLRF